MRSRKAFDDWMKRMTCARPDCDARRLEGALLCPYHIKMERRLIDMAKRPDTARPLYGRARESMPLNDDNGSTQT